VADILFKYGPSGTPFDVVSNPEFLREGSAVQDLLKPDRVVIGASRKSAAEKVVEIYKRFNCPIVLTDLKSAEMVKYASNAFLATKISYINEIANLCDKVGADIADVVKGMSLDPRIGGQFFSPGIGFGGSCFPKDVSALVHIGRRNGCPFRILPGVLAVNDHQRMSFLKKVKKTVGAMKGRTMAVWGLSFKPNTDDLREAPSRTIVNALVQEGAKVRAYDPIVNAEKGRSAFPKVKFCRSAYEAARDAEILLLLTEWNEFKEVDLQYLKRVMKRPIILDGRNIYDPVEVRDMGFTYQGMGR
jgi:UDPglucose 6-dehydrogenase